jgi:hypothetical protein
MNEHDPFYNSVFAISTHETLGAAITLPVSLFPSLPTFGLCADT